MDDLVSSGRIHISVDESVSISCGQIRNFVQDSVSLWTNLHL